MSKITVAGYVGSEPQVFNYQSGSRKAVFSVAVARSKTDKDWYEIECWTPHTIDKVIPWIKTGSFVSVQGRLVINQWEDRQTGDTRSKPIIHCQKIGLGPKPTPKPGAA